MKPLPAPENVPAMARPDAPATPDWAKDAVWYQVFPERFRNGAAQSNPKEEDIATHSVPGWHVSPWGMQWYALDDWEWAGSDAAGRSVFLRRFGGDLVGLREKLPYLQELGITALYLNPVFMAASLHKYDATSYHHIDPTLGPDREGDLRALAKAGETENPATWIWTAADRFFLELVADVHARGMRLIIDGVFNHSGTRCFAFEDIRKNGPASRYRDWYITTNWDDGILDYDAWDGPNGSLPNFGRTDDTLNPGIKQYLFDITRRWMDPSGKGRPQEGIDGWRLDVAYCLPHTFWREWHAHVRAINPDAYTTAEVFGETEQWVRPDEFAGVMNYEWLFHTLSFLTPHPDAIGAAEFRRRMNRLYARHAPGSLLLLQNLLDSHDTGRILTMLESACPPFADWNTYFTWAKADDNPAVKTQAPSAEAKRRLMLAAVWQFTGPGAPMIYYGTEVGLWGANDPDDRQPMLWPDLPADPETLGPRGRLDVQTPRAPDPALFRWYQTLIRLRKQLLPLRRGAFQWLASANEDTLVYERRFADERLIGVLNKGERAAPLPALTGDLDVLLGGVDMAGEIPPSSCLLLRLR
ncbi:MAG: glycoside hydrolase family 13 protein [Verrucomicrobiota bacterium]|jgi:glycosidase|nr:glycoside hydrolase family 13 protein [Verrucomicrobiota bacterium]